MWLIPQVMEKATIRAPADGWWKLGAVNWPWRQSRAGTATGPPVADPRPDSPRIASRHVRESGCASRRVEPTLPYLPTGSPRPVADVRSAGPVLLAEEPIHGYQRSSRDPPAQLGTRKPSLVWCTRTMQQLEEEGLFRAQEQEERREYGLTRGGERMGALTGPRSSQTPWEGVARARTTPQLGDLIVQEDAAFVHVARTVTPQQMAEARMCWPIPPGEPVPDSG